MTGSEEGRKDNSGLEKEVLEALFSCPERYEEAPKLTRRFVERRGRAAGRPVIKPLEDPFQERVVTVKQSSHTSKQGYRVRVLYMYVCLSLNLKSLLKTMSVS